MLILQSSLSRGILSGLTILLTSAFKWPVLHISRFAQYAIKNSLVLFLHNFRFINVDYWFWVILFPDSFQYPPVSCLINVFFSILCFQKKKEKRPVYFLKILSGKLMEEFYIISEQNKLLINKIIYLFLNHSNSKFILQPKKIASFEDAKQRAWQWKKAIEVLQNRWIFRVWWHILWKSLHLKEEKKSWGSSIT